MGYLHINNLYKDQRILLFKEVYALEKIHGTSSNIRWSSSEKKIYYYPGGENMSNFVSLFDEDKLKHFFSDVVDNKDVIIFGEAYGGKQQGMSNVYGPKLKFVAFDVKINNVWLNVPNASDFCKKAEIDFVHYVKIPAELEFLDKEKETESIQAIKNGMGNGKPREGIVIRPLQEFFYSNGERCIAKHKRDQFRETKSPRKVLSVEEIKQMKDIDQIVDEYVVPMRLQHILSKFQSVSKKDIGTVVKCMIEDILREGSHEIDQNINMELLKKKIGNKTFSLLKDQLKEL